MRNLSLLQPGVRCPVQRKLNTLHEICKLAETRYIRIFCMIGYTVQTPALGPPLPSSRVGGISDFFEHLQDLTAG